MREPFREANHREAGLAPGDDAAHAGAAWLLSPRVQIDESVDFWLNDASSDAIVDVGFPS